MKKILECAKFCLSKDETRRFLTGFCHYEPLKAFITCDGHKLFYAEHLYDHEMKNLIINPNTLERIKADYLKVQTVIPDRSKMKSMEVELKKTYYVKDKKPVRAFFSEGGKITLFDKPEKYLFCIDANYLKPLADGSTYTINFKDEFSPVVFNIADRCFMLIMSLKAND